MKPRAPSPADGTEDSRAVRSATTDSGRSVPVLAALGVGLLAVVVLLLSGMSGPAEALFPINNFTNVDDTATVTPSGQQVAVSGWVKCTEGQSAEVRVTVFQGSTGAEATGRTRARCLGQEDRQVWTVHVTTRGAAAFDPSSPVRVEAWAVTRSQGERTDGPHTWTNEEVDLIELIAREPPRGEPAADRSLRAAR